MKVYTNCRSSLAEKIKSLWEGIWGKTSEVEFEGGIGVFQADKRQGYKCKNIQAKNSKALKKKQFQEY